MSMEGQTSEKFSFYPPSWPSSPDIAIFMFGEISECIIPGDLAVCRAVISQSTAKDEKNSALKVIEVVKELVSGIGPGG